MRIEHFDKIGRTPAMRLAVAGWHELLEAGLCDDGACAVAWDHKAIVVFSDDDTPVGCLTWFDQDWTSTIHVAIAYVLPQHRRKGYHTAMFEALVAKARELKRPVIDSTVHAANEPSRRAMLKQGREIKGFYTRYRVPLG